MAKYKNIKLSEHKICYGDVVVFASYPDNNFAIIGYHFAKADVKTLVFNLRKCVRDEIQEKLKQEPLIEDMLYIDDKENADIAYIQKKSCELISPDDNVRIVIDRDGIIDYTEDEIIRLHKLSRDLHTAIMITAHLLDSAKRKKYPTLEDVGNNAIVELADSIVVSNDEKSAHNILIKNKHGKIGILE